MSLLNRWFLRRTHMPCGAHLWIVIDDRYYLVTICHDIPRLRATTCHFDPHPEVGVDVQFGLMRFLCELRSAKAD